MSRRKQLRANSMEPNPPPSKPPVGWEVALIGRRPRYTAIRTVALIVISLVVFSRVLLPIRVEGVSMLPTYKENGINFVNCFAYLLHGPQRGDVVAIRYAGKHIMLMKRIIALPG